MRYQLFPITIALAGLSALASSPSIAQPNSASILTAQRSYYAPQIETLSVSPVPQLSPGTEIVFTLRGTPNSIATINLGNSVQNLPMEEIASGLYEARYVIRSWDRFTDNTTIQANLRQGARTTNIRLQQPITAFTTAGSNQSDSYGNPTGSYGNRGIQPLAIDRFTLQPYQQITPGTELNFNLVGTPNAAATFSIEGITYNQPMQEVSRGVYQGQYVVRRQDYLPTSGARVTASLQLGSQIVRSQLSQGLFANNFNSSSFSNNVLPLEIISPTNNTQVDGTVEIRGRSAPNATVAVSVKATTSLAGIIGFDRNLMDRTIQADAQGNFRVTFTPAIPVPGTRYQVSLNATQGNQTNEQTLVLVQQ